MEDSAIIQLYFDRDERAIGYTDEKYGPLCTRIAWNIVCCREDAEECVNDTYHAAWRAIPPQRPASLRAFLTRITRNFAISRLRQEEAQKRGGGQLLSELSDCLPDRNTPEKACELHVLTATIARWLDGLRPDERALFIRRYYFADDLKTLAELCGQTEKQLAQRMFRLRKRLRQTLEKEGIAV